MDIKIKHNNNYILQFCESMNIENVFNMIIFVQVQRKNKY